MQPIAKILIISGLILAAFGVLWHFGGKYLNLGKLPGDIALEKEHFKFYFPIVTCIILSIILTILVNLFGRLFK